MPKPSPLAKSSDAGSFASRDDSGSRHGSSIGPRLNRRLEQLKQGRYPGGKNAAGTFQKIIDLFPTHYSYAEPFVGSGAIFRRKRSARYSELIDLDPDVVDFWRSQCAPGVSIIRGDGIRWLAKHGPFDRDWLIYVDPPYPLKTRTKKKLYGRFEMTDEQHKELLKVLCTLNANVVISSYASPLYLRYLSMWWHTSFRVVTRGGTMRDEHVWCNFTPGKTNELTRPYAGTDYRDRERIKRKVKRHVAQFEKMPAHERQALLNALLEANS
jgi:DNA adenine methylase